MRRLVFLGCVVLVAGCGGGAARRPAEPPGPVPGWVRAENLPSRAIRGATVFATVGCTACHTYAGSGKQVLGAPDLTAIGRRNLGVAFEIRHLQCPACTNPGSPMPGYSSMGRKRLRELAIFLEASKGAR